MKKIITLICFILSSTATAGGFGSVEYGSNKGVNGNIDQHTTKVTVGTTITDNFKVDVSQLQKTADSTDAIRINRTEVGGSYSIPVANGLTAYTRIGVGQKYFTTANKDFTYYSVEPGLRYSITPNLTARVAFRYRQAFDNSTYDDHTRSQRAGLEYQLNKNYLISLSYERARGIIPESSDNVVLGLGIKF